MGTAGDDYLSRLLGTGEATDGPATEVTEAEDKARAAERVRVFNARFNPFYDGSATATTTMHGGGNSGGGYRFDAETIKSKITQWEQLLDDLSNDGRGLMVARQAAQPPSDDTPAKKQVNATWQSIDKALDHNLKMQQYAQGYIDKLRQANGTYVPHDQDVAASLSAGSDTGNLFK